MNQAHLPRPDLDVEVTPLIGDLENLGPGKAVDSQAVPVDEQAIGTDTKHDIDALRVLHKKRAWDESSRARQPATTLSSGVT